jgi:hypothetical protein
MSLETPEKIRTFQRKLYCKAKAEPSFRFYLLYDKICREDILQHAYALARANAGAPGVDGESFTDIEAAGVEKWLAGLREELISKTYRPAPVRRVMIPKPGGGERPLVRAWAPLRNLADINHGPRNRPIRSLPRRDFSLRQRRNVGIGQTELLSILILPLTDPPGTTTDDAHPPSVLRKAPMSRTPHRGFFAVTATCMPHF